MIIDFFRFFPDISMNNTSKLSIKINNRQIIDKKSMISSIVDWVGFPNHVIDYHISISIVEFLSIGLDWIGIPDK